MKLLSMTLRRPNVRGKLSVSYRWNVIWSEELRNILVVECYGFSSDKGYAWCISPPELTEFMKKRLDRFNYDSSRDVLKPEESEVIDHNGLSRRLVQWTEKNDWPSDMKKAWDIALYRFKNASVLEALNDHEALVHNMMATLVPLETVSTSEPKVQLEPPKAVNWGAW